MVDESAAPRDVLYVRQRALGVILGAATAVGLSLFFPAAGQMGLVTIPIWRRILAGRDNRRAARGA